ncbi:hypothetical protein RV11_GL002330 [Enterococcus phoeniculicola]|nr:hypothetical protein RV11_GL002330 [Enterococcus phoeniculicola]
MKRNLGYVSPFFVKKKDKSLKKSDSFLNVDLLKTGELLLFVKKIENF